MKNLSILEPQIKKHYAYKKTCNDKTYLKMLLFSTFFVWIGHYMYHMFLKVKQIITNYHVLFFFTPSNTWNEHETP